MNNLNDWIRGIHHKISGDHLQSYLEKFNYRLTGTTTPPNTLQACIRGWRSCRNALIHRLLHSNPFNRLNEIIISFNCPSFGDYLMFSNLPELFYKKYNLYTYISNDCVFYNFETYKLLFEQNPYVKGLTDKEPNTFIDCRNPKKGVFQSKIYCQRYDLFDCDKIPKIYYEPKKINDYENVILFDVATRSLGHLIPKITERANNLLKDIKNTDQNLKICVLKYKDTNNINRLIPNVEFNYIEVENIFEYCDILSNIKYYIGINSVSSLIASSIKEYYNSDLKIFYYTPIIGTADGGNWNPINVDLIFF